MHFCALVQDRKGHRGMCRRVAVLYGGRNFERGCRTKAVATSAPWASRQPLDFTPTATCSHSAPIIIDRRRGFTAAESKRYTPTGASGYFVAPLCRADVARPATVAWDLQPAIVAEVFSGLMGGSRSRNAPENTSEALALGARRDVTRCCRMHQVLRLEADVRA